MVRYPGSMFDSAGLWLAEGNVARRVESRLGLERSPKTMTRRSHELGQR